MRRFTILFAAALLTCAALASNADAQVVYVQFGRPYTPAYVPPAITPAYYVAPGYVVPSGVPLVAPTYASTIRVVPQSTAYYSYYAPPVYAAPQAVYSPGVITTRTIETRGIFHPRVIVTERTYFP